MIFGRITPQLARALRIARNFHEPDGTGDREYTRGQAELIINLFDLDSSGEIKDAVMDFISHDTYALIIPIAIEESDLDDIINERTTT